MLRMMDRHFYRPAHIHLLVRREGHKELVTQIFDKNCKYLQNDTVFAVKDDLVVDFKPKTDDPKAQLDLEYNVTMALKKHHPNPNSAPPVSSFERFNKATKEKL